MNIFITGATGKIGRLLLDRLIEEGRISISALVQDKDGGSLPGGIKICRGDIADLNSLRHALKDVDGIDTVLHMAAVTHTNKRDEYYRVNLEGTRNLIKICEERSAGRIIFISSRAAVAGGGDYAESKLAAEDAVKSSGLNWLILAFGEVYSINGKDEINRICNLIKRHYFIPIIGRGRYGLAPVYIEDAVNSIKSALEKEHLRNKRYIICGREEISFRELVNTIIRLLGVKRKIISIPPGILRLIFRTAAALGSSIIAYDQLDRLLADKPSDIKDAAADLDHRPEGFADVLRRSCL